MQINNNGGADPNYRPNSFNNIIADENNKEPPMELDSNIADWLNRNYNDNHHYTQAGLFFQKALNDLLRKNLIRNIVGDLSSKSQEKRNEIINPHVCHFFHADFQPGMTIAQGLSVAIEENSTIHAH